MHIFTNPNYNFLRWRWHAVALSWLVILSGLGMIAAKGLPKGIEFAGGTSVIMQFDQTPSVDTVRGALNQNFPGGGQNAIVQTYGDAALRHVMVRVPQVGAEHHRHQDGAHVREGRPRHELQPPHLIQPHVGGHTLERVQALPSGHERVRLGQAVQAPAGAGRHAVAVLRRDPFARSRQAFGFTHGGRSALSMRA